MIIDTHSHLNFIAYKDDLDAVAQRTLKEGIFCINVGSNYENSRKAMEISEKYNGMYASVGLHPIHLASDFFKIKKDTNEQEGDDTNPDNFNIARYKDLVLRSRSDEGKNKIIAIGEIGLDYYYRPKTKIKTEAFKARQKEFFVKQLDLSEELNLPIIFHCRMAHSDTIEILKNYSGLRGVMHCFTGTAEEMKQYLDMGFYIGFNGIIFKLPLDEIIKQCPLEKILIETDCPYLTPPKAGVERNEPLFVKYVAERIAELKGVSFEEVADKTTANAKKLFKI